MEKELLPNTNMDSIRFYNDNYRRLFFVKQRETKNGYEVLLDDSEKALPQKKYYISNSSNGTCRFCGGKIPNVSFSKIEHAIPECFGNKTIFSFKAECDRCNELFGRYESSFSNYKSSLRPFSTITGKNGSVSYKSFDGKSRVFMSSPSNNAKYLKNHENTPPEEGNVVFVTEKGSGNFILDESNKCFIYTFDIPAFRPSSVYKALLKMAISVMPFEFLSYFNNAKKSLLDEKHESFLSTALFGLLPGFNAMELTAMIYVRKSENRKKIPVCIFGVMFESHLFQIIIPADDECYSIGEKVGIVPIPTKYDIIGVGLGGFKYELRDLKSVEIVKGCRQSVRFGLDSLELAYEKE